MSNTEPITETFYDGATDITIIRELTADEIAALPELADEVPTTGV